MTNGDERESEGRRDEGDNDGSQAECSGGRCWLAADQVYICSQLTDTQREATGAKRHSGVLREDFRDQRMITMSSGTGSVLDSRSTRLPRKLTLKCLRPGPGDRTDAISADKDEAKPHTH